MHLIGIFNVLSDKINFIIQFSLNNHSILLSKFNIKLKTTKTRRCFHNRIAYKSIILLFALRLILAAPVHMTEMKKKKKKNKKKKFFILVLGVYVPEKYAKRAILNTMFVFSYDIDFFLLFIHFGIVPMMHCNIHKNMIN